MDGGADHAASGYTLIGTGSDDSAVIRFDGEDPFEEAAAPEVELDLPLVPTAEELERFIDTAIDRLK